MIPGQPDLRRSSRPVIFRPEVPVVTEIDFDRLRRGRLERLQAAMRRHGMAVTLLYNFANIRYATGTDLMAVWTGSTLERYAVVPAEGTPVICEFRTGEHTAEKGIASVRTALSWQWAGSRAEDIAREWASQIRDLMRELGVAGEPIAVDKLDATGFLALADAGLEVRDAWPACAEARRVKTPEEVALFRINGAIGDAMLHEFEAAIRPGGSRARPPGGAVQRAAAASRRVSVHAARRFRSQHQSLAPGGHRSRASTGRSGGSRYRRQRVRRATSSTFRAPFLCGDRATPAQKEAYRVAWDCVNGMIEMAPSGPLLRAFCPGSPGAAGRLQASALLLDGPSRRTGGREPGNPLSLRARRQGPRPRARREHRYVLRMLCRQGRSGLRSQARGPGAHHQQRL